MKRKITLSERVSVGFVRFSAAFTILSLFLILGYIMWNGFFYSNRYEYAVASPRSDSVGGLVAVVNSKVRRAELPFDILQNCFADEYTTWKRVDEQDLDMYPYVSDGAAPGFAKTLDLAEAGALVEYPGDAEATILAVRSQPGGIALLTSEELASLSSSEKHGTRVMHLRTVAFAVNPTVTALKDNMRIGTIDESDIARLYMGEITNWSELNGYDLPVTMVVPPVGDPLRALADKAGAYQAPANALRPASLDEYYRVLAETPGAAGYADANRVRPSGLGFINLARMESGRNLSLAFLLEAPVDSGKIGGISTIILNTFAMIFLTLLFSVPPGIFAAIYLVEYAKEGRLVRIIRLGTETLAGIPSIIFGLFGMLVFVQGFRWGISLLSGSLTITLMILPTIVRTAEEALKSVPHALQEGSLALGATKVQTIFKVVLPAAFPAIASGIILAVGRALGETAALLYTMGSNYKLTSGLFDSTRTLAVHIYLIVAEGISSDKAFASGAVLVFFILGINTAARFLIGRMGRMARA